jgi:hypothetical protein
MRFFNLHFHQIKTSLQKLVKKSHILYNIRKKFDFYFFSSKNYIFYFKMSITDYLKVGDTKFKRRDVEL